MLFMYVVCVNDQTYDCLQFFQGVYIQAVVSSMQKVPEARLSKFCSDHQWIFLCSLINSTWHVTVHSVQLKSTV